MSVRKTKFSFILLAFGLTILLFSWPTKEASLTLSAKMEGVPSSATLTKTPIGEIASTIMEKPHFTGEDDKNRRWGLDADRAVQTSKNHSEMVILENIKAFSTLANGKVLHMKANEGSYVNEKQDIGLQGAVEAQGYGYTLKTEVLQGNIKTQNFESTAPVLIEGVKGKVEAGKFEMFGEKGKVSLSSGIKIRVYPKRTEKTYAEEIK